MLRWRLLLGTILIAALVGLCWLDSQESRAGIFLFPLAIFACVLGATELLAIFRKQGHDPLAWTVIGGMLLTLTSAAQPRFFRGQWLGGVGVGHLGWLAIGLAAALIMAFVGELWRFGATINGASATSRAGQAIVNLALACFAILYVGGLIGFMIQLRLVGASPDLKDGRVGMLALISLIATVKMSDTGQYAVGRLIGRHKLAPRVSPGKTWEGAAGGVLFAIVAAWVVFRWAGPKIADVTAPDLSGLAIITFALAVTVAGLVGDLGESLLKRDAGIKDSSTWMPGFGGVLDLLDSLLVAAPVAYVFWALWFLAP